MANKHKKFQKKCKRGWRNFSKNFHFTAKKIVIIVIAIAMAAVGIVLLVNLVFNNEAITKRKIEGLARDYYENYYYEKVEGLAGKDGAPNVMAGYAESGLSRISLRQLLLFDNGKNMAMMDEIMAFCDTDLTNVKIYPEDPYGNKDYHIEYNYSCNF